MDLTIVKIIDSGLVMRQEDPKLVNRLTSRTVEFIRTSVARKEESRFFVQLSHYASALRHCLFLKTLLIDSVGKKKVLFTRIKVLQRWFMILIGQLVDYSMSMMNSI